MEVDPGPLQSVSADFERPALSYTQGAYSGYNPLFAGNQVAPNRAADWNWLSLYFSTAQSSLQSGAQPTGTRLTNASITGLFLPDMTTGSVLFAAAGGQVTQNNTDLYWDNASTLLKARKITAGTNMSLGGNLEAGNFFSTYTSAQIDASNPNVLEAHAVWSDTVGSPSGTIRGLYAQARLDRAAAFTGICNAFLAEALTFAACTVATLVGISGTANVQSGGTGTDCYGFQGGSYVLAAGDTMTTSSCVQGIGGTFNGGAIGSQTAVRATLDAFGGTITNWYGYKLDILTFAGGCVITNLYGLYLPSITGASTLNYAIYSLGGQSYHAGNLGIGVVVPTVALDVVGKAKFTGTGPTLDLTDATANAGGSIRFGSAQSLIYEAVNNLGLRNGTSAQTFAVYNTFTAGTPDFEKLNLSWSGNVATIGMTKGGTGTARTLSILQADGSTAWTIPAAIGSAIALGTPTPAATVFSNGIFRIANAASYTRASAATCVILQIDPNLTDSGSNSAVTWYVDNHKPTINYSGASKTGKVYVQYMNPTATSLPTGQNAGLAFSSAFNVSGLPAIVLNNQTDEDTNYEKLTLSAVSNIFTCSSIAAGSGTVRDIAFTVANAAGSAIVKHTATSTITGAVTDGYTSSLRLTPTYNAASALTVTRHNYIDMNDVVLGGAGPAAVTDSAIIRLDAALGTHKATTNTDRTGNTKSGTLKVNVAGTLYYIQLYA